MHFIKAPKPSLTFVLAIFCAALFSLSESFSQDLNQINKISFSSENILEILIAHNTQFKPEFKIFTLSEPDRLVIDIKNSNLKYLGEPILLPSFVAKVRTRFDQNNLRIVFDLNNKVTIEKNSFQKIAGQEYGKIIAQISSINLLGENKKTPTYKVVNSNFKIPVIVIDAGHGGKDPGTIGNYARTKEKNITLSYAKELKKYLDNTKHYKTYLTRDNDIFIPLKQRVEKARKLKADLFISLHANSIDDGYTSGLSIYTLSETSSDKQAELLAQKENRADIIAGVNFSGASQDIMKTLIDLSQRDSMNNSSNFANIVINSSKKSEIKILQNTHRFAGFAVLTAPDMASTLIELGYLSNKQEERALNSLSYKRQITQGIANAIDEYFSKTKN